MNMSIRTAVFCTVLGVSAAVVPLMSSARVYLDVNVAPPPPPEEGIPPPRHGYVWAPGYYDYDGHRHHWRHGHWIREHRGRHWVSDRWEDRGGRWHHERGHWE